MRDGVPLPSVLSGDVEERLIRLDKSLFYIVAGALEFITDKQRYEQTGMLTVDDARSALSQMLWEWYNLTPTLPAGAIVPFAGDSIPSGWLACDGSSKLRADYPDLFTAIGTTWGSVDGTHFTLPDLRGRAAIGDGTGAGLTARALGASGGEETHLLTTAEIPAHDHPYIDATGGSVQATSKRRLSTGTSTTWIRRSGDAIESAGGDGAHNNMQPFAVVKYIISTGG